MKTIFENSGGTYTQVGNYLLPNLSLSAEEKETNIGVWAMRHKRYLKQNHKVRYYNLLTSGKLDSYLADIEEQKHPLINAIIGEMVPSVCTEDDNVIATTLHQTFRHRNICLDFIRIDDFAYLVAHYT